MISMSSATFRCLEEADHRASIETLLAAAPGVPPATVQVWAMRLAAAGFVHRRDFEAALACLAEHRRGGGDWMPDQVWRVLDDEASPPRARLSRLDASGGDRGVRRAA